MTAIVFSGYTAAGKTTHSRLLAQALGYRHVWAAGLLLERLGYEDIPRSESELWFHHFASIEERRGSSDADSWVDEQLVTIATQDNVIIDSRFLPWLPASSTLNIWLESNLPSRARKCHGSVAEVEPVPTLTECAVHVHDKDGRDIARVASTYQGVFGPDPLRHQLIIDISAFAPAHSARTQDALIAAAQEYVFAAVSWHHGDVAPAARLAAERPDEAQAVFYAIPGLWHELS